MASEPIGRIKCTLCGDECAVTEQKNNFAMYSCPWCGAQHFARSKHSDEKMRGMMIKGSAPVMTPNEPKPKPAEPVASPEPVVAAAPAKPAPKAKPTPPPAKKSVFGF